MDEEIRDLWGFEGEIPDHLPQLFQVANCNEATAQYLADEYPAVIYFRAEISMT